MQDSYPVKTYNEELDKIIGGFYPGELTLICGRNGFQDEQVEFLFSLVKMNTFANGFESVLYTNYTNSKDVYGRFIQSFTLTYYGKKIENNKNNKELVKNITKQVYDLPLIINYSRDLYNIQDLCNQIRNYYKCKSIKILYWAGPLTIINDDSTIQEERFGEDRLIFQELKCLAQELNIPIVVTYETRVTDFFYDKDYTWIEKVANSVISLERTQFSSDYTFYQTPISVLKTHDGKIGKFVLAYYKEVINSPEDY